MSGIDALRQRVFRGLQGKMSDIVQQCGRDQLISGASGGRICRCLQHVLRHGDAFSKIGCRAVVGKQRAERVDNLCRRRHSVPHLGHVLLSNSRNVLSRPSWSA